MSGPKESVYTEPIELGISSRVRDKHNMYNFSKAPFDLPNLTGKQR